MSAPLLALRSISKSFDGVQALRGVDFTLRSGEVHALLGENGAGKTTLIRVITGAHRPDAGSIEIEGRTVSRLQPGSAHRLGIACIYQQPALFPQLTVAENIALRLEPVSPRRWVDWTERRRKADALLGRIGASLSPDAEVHTLSMPQQQLVEIACALGAGARIIVMDEPTASLTRQEQDLLFAVVRDLRSQGTGIIYISHRLDEIAALADRVTVLRDGASVGTHEVRDTSESQLIQMMVGRELQQIYPPGGATPGDIVLGMRDVGCRSAGVRHITLGLRAGEILGLAGLVGAGRTELARVLFGLTPADSGKMILAGREFHPRSPADAIAAGVAYVPEDRRRHGVIGEMSIAENLSMAIHRRLFPGTWIRPRAETALALEMIQALAIKCERPSSPVSHLSGGNQQKVSFGRWLAARPKLLILDEPTQGVDVGAKSEIHRIIRRLASEGMAVLLISSDLPEVIGMSDRIGVMRGGTIIDMLPGQPPASAVMAAALGQFRSSPAA